MFVTHTTAGPCAFGASRDRACGQRSWHIEKLEAVDRLQTFVDGLRLDEMLQGNCRFIVDRDEDDPNAAMRVLGRAAFALLAPPGADSG